MEPTAKTLQGRRKTFLSNSNDNTKHCDKCGSQLVYRGIYRCVLCEAEGRIRRIKSGDVVPLNTNVYHGPEEEGEDDEPESIEKRKEQMRKIMLARKKRMSEEGFDIGRI